MIDARALYVTAVCIRPNAVSPSAWLTSTTVTSAMTREITRTIRIRIVLRSARLPALAVSGTDAPSTATDMSGGATAELPSGSRSGWCGVVVAGVVRFNGGGARRRHGRPHGLRDRGAR